MNLRTGILSLALLLATGCGVKPTIEGRNDPFLPAQVNIADSDLRTSTALGPAVIARDEAGLLHVQVPIRAASNKQLYIEYRVSFVDANGMTLPGPTAWFSKTLAPNVPDAIQFNSTSPRAANFHMDLRRSRIN